MPTLNLSHCCNPSRRFARQSAQPAQLVFSGKRLAEKGVRAWGELDRPPWRRLTPTIVTYLSSPLIVGTG